MGVAVLAGGRVVFAWELAGMAVVEGGTVDACSGQSWLSKAVVAALVPAEKQQVDIFSRFVTEAAIVLPLDCSKIAPTETSGLDWHATFLVMRVHASSILSKGTSASLNGKVIGTLAMFCICATVVT